jgi:hypothetical protein
VLKPDGILEIRLTAVNGATSSGQFEELVDELNLTPNTVPVHPASLPLPDHVDGFVTLESLAEPPGILGNPASPSRAA